MPDPYKLTPQELRAQLPAVTDQIFSALQSQFLVMPKGPRFVEYADFQQAYEVLRRHTRAYELITSNSVQDALKDDALCWVVLRAMLGLSPPEWAHLASSQDGVAVSQNFARDFDSRCKDERNLFARGIRGVAK